MYAALYSLSRCTMWYIIGARETGGCGAPRRYIRVHPWPRTHTAPILHALDPFAGSVRFSAPLEGVFTTEGANGPARRRYISTARRRRRRQRKRDWERKWVYSQRLVRGLSIFFLWLARNFFAPTFCCTALQQRGRTADTAVTAAFIIYLCSRSPGFACVSYILCGLWYHNPRGPAALKYTCVALSVPV